MSEETNPQSPEETPSLSSQLPDYGKRIARNTGKGLLASFIASLFTSSSDPTNLQHLANKRRVLRWLDGEKMGLSEIVFGQKFGIGVIMKIVGFIVVAILLLALYSALGANAPAG